MGLGTIHIHATRFKVLKHFENKTSQFELLAHFDTQFIKWTKALNLNLLIKVKNTWWQITNHFGNKNSF